MQDGQHLGDLVQPGRLLCQIRFIRRARFCSSEVDVAPKKLAHVIYRPFEAVYQANIHQVRQNPILGVRVAAFKSRELQQLLKAAKLLGDTANAV